MLGRISVFFGWQNEAAAFCFRRRDVKRTLFICALVAIKNDPEMRAFYEKLIKSGKKKMVAIVAGMRKMIIILNTKCKNID